MTPAPPDAWPALMRPRTLAAYLDCLDIHGRIGPRFAWWRRQAGFPLADPEAGSYWREDVDRFLRSRFSDADPVAAGIDELDKRYGT